MIAGNIIEKTTARLSAHRQGRSRSGLRSSLHAIISKTGSIANLSVISGPAMLQSSALDAVKQWRYKPYILNGEPTEVDTTVTVNFNLGGG